MNNEIRNLKIAVVALFAFVLFNGAIKKPYQPAPLPNDETHKRMEPVGDWNKMRERFPDRRQILMVDGLNADEFIAIGPGADNRLMHRMDANGEPVIEFLDAEGKVVGVITAADARKP